MEVGRGPGAILFLDDERGSAGALLSTHLTGSEISALEPTEEALIAAALGAQPVVLFVALQPAGGLTLTLVVATWREHAPGIPLIVVANEPTTDGVVFAIRCGADDVIDRTNAHRLGRVVARAVHRTAHVERSRHVRNMLAVARQHLRKSLVAGADGFYRWLMETSKKGVLVTDAGTRTTFMNAQMAAMLRVDAAKALGRHLLTFFHDSQHAGIRARLRELRHGKAYVVEHHHVRPDGSTFDALLEATPIFDEAGAYAGGIAVMMDITAWKAAEAAQRQSEARVEEVESQLRQSQKMEAVGRLAGGIAHDFNNMLSIILGYGESVLEEIAEGSRIREDVAEILLAANRASDLTRQLLLFSRRHVVQPAVVDLAELVRSMQKMLQRIVGEDIEMVVAPFTGMAPPLVVADRSGIEMVLLNLVVNARDAMPRGGQLFLALEEHGANLRLSVRDTGSGMDEATAARIFDPFFTTKEPGKGTGLGLATVSGIVARAGGTIRVDSAPGVGTTFDIELARADAPPPRVAVPCDPVVSPARATILLVEDEDQVRHVARRVLERDGHRVLEARTPLEALEQVAHFDLLLTDVVMPQMSGAELARRFLAAQIGLKVIFMSGYTDEHLNAHGVLSESASYLSKPFTPTDLSKKVRDVLSGRAN